MDLSEFVSSPAVLKEDLSQADIAVNCLGDPGGEPVMMTRADKKFEFTNVVTVSQIMDYFAD